MGGKFFDYDYSFISPKRAEKLKHKVELDRRWVKEKGAKKND